MNYENTGSSIQETIKEVHLDYERTIEEFIKHALIHDETQHSGDFKTGNKSATILFTLSAQIEKDQEYGPIIVDRLLKESNASILIWTSAISIKMHDRKRETIAILKKLARNQDIGIQRFNAEMTLREIAKVHAVFFS